MQYTSGIKRPMVVVLANVLCVQQTSKRTRNGSAAERWPIVFLLPVSAVPLFCDVTCQQLFKHPGFTALRTWHCDGNLGTLITGKRKDDCTVYAKKMKMLTLAAGMDRAEHYGRINNGRIVSYSNQQKQQGRRVNRLSWLEFHARFANEKALIFLESKQQILHGNPTPHLKF